MYNDIKKIIRDSNKSRFYKHTEPGLSIINSTNFLDVNTEIRQRLLYIKYDIIECVKCPICKKQSTICRKSKKFKINCCSRLCSLKFSKNSRKKSRYETMSKIDPNTGMSIFEKTTIKSTKTMSKIDPNTGLNTFQASALKSIETRSQINPKTGLTDYQQSNLLGSETKSIIDPVIGLNIHQMSAIKTHDTLSKIDPKTGLTGYQKSVKNRNNTLSKIDPKTELTGYQKYGKKIKNTHTLISYNNKVNNFPIDFQLLSSYNEYINNNILKYKCNKCNSIIESYWPYIRCTKCNPYNKSIGENEVLEFCKSLTNDIISNSRQIISPLELDIYLPDHNLAIEYNGLYWHSSNLTSNENQDYHLMKTQKCTTKGIQLFHIFENEWQDPQKQKIWKSIISNRLGKSERIFARKTGVRSVSSTEKSQFLISNHLQGDCVSSVNLGLFLDDELVSLMTFGRSRYDKKVKWELIRFCNKIGYSVVGGASRLLKAFRKENLGSIISYADKRRSNGNLYNQLGFEFSHESGPNYFYWKSGSMMLESRIGYQKHKLRDRLEVFDPSLTESENMYRNNFRKIYDCGNQVWILK